MSLRALAHAALVAAGVLLAAAPDARAGDSDRAEKEACVAASDQAQNLRDEGKLRAARAALLTCSRDACPGIVRKDCEKWLAEVDAAQPTVVVAVRDPRGRDVIGARVLVDGAVFNDHLEGRPQPIDPGEHVFRYEAPGCTPVQERVLVRVGEKNRSLTAQLQPSSAPASAAPPTHAAPAAPPPTPTEPAPATHEPPPADATTEHASAPVGGYVLAGLGAAALGSFAYFGIAGHTDVDNMRATCAPHCAQSDVDAARTKLIVADVSLGVAVVSVVAAAWIFLAHGSAPSSAPADANAARVDVRPLPGGGLATFGARF